MNHRVKNLFALASGVVMLSARSTQSVKELASAVNGASRRAGTRPVAHPAGLTADGGLTERTATLHDLLRTILSPYEIAGHRAPRLAIEGLIWHSAVAPSRPSRCSSTSSRPTRQSTEACRLRTARWPSSAASGRTWSISGGPNAVARRSTRSARSGASAASSSRRPWPSWAARFPARWDAPGLTIKLSAARDRCVAPPPV